MSLSSANSSLHRYQVMSPDQNSLSTMIGSVKFVDSTFLQLTITTFKFTQRIMRVKRVKRHSTWLIWIRVEEFISRITLGILSRWSSSSSSRHEKDSRQSCGTRIIFFSLTHIRASTAYRVDERSLGIRARQALSRSLISISSSSTAAAAAGQQFVESAHFHSITYGIYSSSINNGKKHIDREGWYRFGWQSDAALCAVRAIKNTALVQTTKFAHTLDWGHR